ncbi:putative adenylate kinase [Toxoplasma gondii TgCatPRC2]|uniref:Putative adenylate kinase n=1 Tax=Toxoplasma gondii TgCatPRC2 TaxID=1130821 RepID=A0A151HC25_TOXGO|nr:putative adenylate kinase [Toxoplasma gondii TgCatPRC2]
MPGKSTDSLSTVNKSFVDEAPMNWEDLDIGEDLLTALRRMFPPAFACPATPPLRRALSRPGGISENGKLYFPALTADYLREQRELANDILSDIMKAGSRALKLYHGDTSTSGMARILAMHINKTPAAVAAAPPFLQTAAPLPTPIRGVEPYTPLADLLSLGLEEARARERREAEDEVVEEREGETSDEEDLTPTGFEEGRDQQGSQAHLEANANSDAAVADDADAYLSHRSGASTARESAEESDLPQVFSRIWSAWKQSCPVTLFDEGVAAEGRRELAVDYAGRVFLFADEEKQKRFLDDPKTFLGRAPTLEAKKIAVAFSGANRRDAVKQAALLADAFGLAVVDVHLELHREQQRAAAWDRRRREFEKRREERFRERPQWRDAGDRDRSVVGVSKEGDEGRERKEEHEENTLGGRDQKLENADLRNHREEPDEPAEEELEEPIPPSPRMFQLTESERAALREGKPLGENGEETIARVVAHSLGLEDNVQMLEERRAEEERLRVLIEEFEKKQADSEEELVFPSDIPVDPETHEITLPPLSLLRPACGFVIVHLGRTKREEEALARYGVKIKHWIHFTADVAEEEKEAHKMLQELQAEADAAAEAIEQLQRRRPAACPNSSLPQPRISQDFYDPLGQQASLFLDGSLAKRGFFPEKGDMSSPFASSSSSAPLAVSSGWSPRAETGGEGGGDSTRSLANQRDEGQTDVPLQRVLAEGLPDAEQEGRGRNWGTGTPHQEGAALAVKELALLTQEEERLFLEYEEGQPDSDLDVSMIRIYTHLSDMAKHYRIRQAIDPFFVAPDDPETIPPLPDLASILAQVDDCTSLHLAPNDRREAPYSTSFPFLPPLPTVFYGETGHYCPVSLRRQQWLLPGKPEFAVSVQQRIYMCYDRRAKALLSLNPHEFIPSSYLAQQEESQDRSQNTRLDLTGRSAIEDEEEDFCTKVKKEVHVPPPRIAFLGSIGSEVSTHMELFNSSASLPVLHFPSHFSRALKRLLLRYRRQTEMATKRENWQEKVAEMGRQGRSEGGDSQAAGELVDAEEARAAPQEAAVRFSELEDEMTEDETSPQNSLVFFDVASQNSEGGASGKTTTMDRLYGRFDWQQDVWQGWETFDLPEKKLQQIRVEAVRQVLHSAMGPALIDGSSFLPLPPVQPRPEDEDEERELALSAPSFASLLDESQRLPDAVVVLTASTQTAAQRTLDLEEIKREAIEAAKRKLAARQERQRKREEREQRRARTEERGEDFDEEEQDEEDEEDEEEEDEGTVDPLARAAETAAKEALRDFSRRKAMEDEIVLRSAKLFASARVPVLVVNSERTEKTVQRAIGNFLLPFLKHRQSLLLAPQCMRLDKASCAQFLKSGVAKHSRFGVFSPTDVDAMIYPASLDSPVLLNSRIYYPGPTKVQAEQFCMFPSFFLSSPLPAPRQCVPRCCFLGPPLSGKSRIARLIADWSGAVYVTPQKALRQCIEEAKSSQLVEQVVQDLRRGRAVSSCCLIRVVHQRLRHSDVVQRGFVLDGYPTHVGQAKRFQVLESLHRIEIPASGRLQDDVHLHAPSPSSTPRAPSSRPSLTGADAVAEAVGEASDGERGGGGRQAGPASRRGGADKGGEGEGNPGEEFESARATEKREGEVPEVFRKLARETFRKAMETKQKRQGESGRKDTGRGGDTERERAEKWRRSRSSAEEGTHAKETETKPEKLTRPHTALLEDVALSKTNGQNNTPSSRAMSESKRGQREETEKEMCETEEKLETGGGEEERETEDKSERREDDGGARRDGDDEGDANEAEHESREVGEDPGDQEWEDDENEEEGEAANRDGVSVDERKKDKDVETRIHRCEEQREDDHEKREEEKRAAALRLAALEARNQQRKSMDAQSLQEDEALEDDEDDESAIDIVFIFQADEHLTLHRAANIHREIRNEFPVNDERDFQANPASQKERWSTYRSTIAPLQAHYSSTYSNVILIPSEASVWRQFEIARKEIEGFCRRKHEYLRRKAAGMAARCFFTGRKQSKIQQLVTEALKTYCPVCWTLEGALNDARGIPFYQAEFQGGVYFCCREGHLEAFLKTPSAYIREGIPKELPTRLALAELQSFASPPQFQFKGFCSVVFAEEKRFVEGHHALVAKYVGEFWKFSSEEALSAFLLYPSNYVELARNVPPEKVEAEALKGPNPPRTLQQIARDGEAKSPPQPALTSLAGELKDALTFLEISTAELLTEALTMAGLKRPVFPGQSFRQSALHFLALYLHAHNVLTPPVSHRDALQSLENFVTDCRLPFDMRDKIFALFRLLQTQEGSRAPLPGETWTIVDELQYLRWTERFDELFKVKDHQSGNATVPLFSV